MLAGNFINSARYESGVRIFGCTFALKFDTKAKAMAINKGDVLRVRVAHKSGDVAKCGSCANQCRR